jgi:cytoskeletal protein RodZ
MTAYKILHEGTSVKKSNNQTGSAHVVIIIILILAILGLLGFVFWQNFIQKKAATSTSTTASSNAASSDPYANWLTYSSDRGAFNLKYPSDWKVSDASATGGDLIRLVSPGIKIEQSNSPDAANYDVDVSFEGTAGSMIASQLSAVAATKLSDKGSDFSQYATKKYTETINSMKVSEFDMVAQSPYFAAVFTVGSNYVQLSFPYASTKADMTVNLTNILASFKAN